ncbi:MAG: hypothetical protein SNG38_08635 [Rikenellaceae bacterium]
METKFKLSDIIKYMLLGAIALVVASICYFHCAPDHFKTFTEYIGERTNYVESFSFVIAASFISSAYIFGILLNALISTSVDYYLKIKSGHKCKLIEKILYFIIYKGTVSDTCYEIKNNYRWVLKIAFSLQNLGQEPVIS